MIRVAEVHRYSARTGIRAFLFCLLPLYDKAVSYRNMPPGVFAFPYVRATRYLLRLMFG